MGLNLKANGIKAQQVALNAISNNIANSTTEGYKAKGVRFQTLLNNEVDGGYQINAGVNAEVAATDFSQGSLAEGTGSLDLSVAGEGFFMVQNNAGESYLTRDGSFTLDGAGNLVDGNGFTLVTGGSIEDVQAGIVDIYMPENVETLQAVGGNYFVDPNNQVNVLEDAGVSVNFIEQSNVDLAKELTNMIVAQRAYSLNVKATQSTDEMMQVINQFYS